MDKCFKDALDRVVKNYIKKENYENIMNRCKDIYRVVEKSSIHTQEDVKIVTNSLSLLADTSPDVVIKWLFMIINSHKIDKDPTFVYDVFKDAMSFHKLSRILAHSVYFLANKTGWKYIVKFAMNCCHEVRQLMMRQIILQLTADMNCASAKDCPVSDLAFELPTFDDPKSEIFIQAMDIDEVRYKIMLDHIMGYVDSSEKMNVSGGVGCYHIPLSMTGTSDEQIEEDISMYMLSFSFLDKDIKEILVANDNFKSCKSGL